MYVYGTRLRPPGPGCIPVRGLKDMDFTEFTVNGRHYWGTASYDRELMEAELEHYDMDKIKEEN